MLQRICRACIILALVTSIGLHWAVIQSAAWVTMVVSYSKTTTVVKALENTFDGEHPCALCKAVQKGAASDDENEKSKQEASAKIKKLDRLLAKAELLTPPSQGDVDFQPFSQSAVSRSIEPHVPPPRFAA